MATRTPLAGWTERRKRLCWRYVLGLAAAAIGVAWAMVMPWAGHTISTGEATCDPGPPSASMPMATANGSVVHLGDAGCISALQSVRDTLVPEAPTQAVPVGSLSRAATPAVPAMSLGQMAAPSRQPTVETKFGLPAVSVWALAAALSAVLAAALRNGVFVPVSLLTWHLSLGALEETRQVLTGTTNSLLTAGAAANPTTGEMYGVAVHQAASWAILALALAAGVHVLKVNAQQRRLDGVPHPVLAFVGGVSDMLLRSNADRIGTLAEIASSKKDAKTA